MKIGKNTSKTGRNLASTVSNLSCVSCLSDDSNEWWMSTFDDYEGYCRKKSSEDSFTNEAWSGSFQSQTPNSKFLSCPLDQDICGPQKIWFE